MPRPAIALPLPLSLPPVRARLRAVMAGAATVSRLERLRAALGGGFGIAITALICLTAAKNLHLTPWLVAPLGASAVLVFAAPSSPLAQPWSVIGGNTVSAIMGLVACNLIPDPVIAASVAVGLAIAAMFGLRCLHPPGGAMALLVVLSGVHAPVFALFPALTNSLLLVGTAMLYNGLTRKPYPHRPAAQAAPASGLLRISPEDMAAALAEHDEVLDIASDDLARLLERSELHAWQRLAGHKTCASIMTAPVHTVRPGTPLKEAHVLMQRHDIKALPVIDRQGRVLGLLVRADMTGLSRLAGLARNAMRRDYVSVRATDGLDRLMPLFSRGDRRHVLVTDADGRLEGVISASDTMRALYHSA
ncbi:HPP family protein [Asticcacaulis sp. EMRT-3]|uniref:HPP family protein n=1 Tax=Asticcacaulis sp. EMRT-3 TaxID=3040349 RepID=UPI0024AF4BDE|nr:HPP family protein [Asticcacaulis sp. EMRT-3]MDI7775996.1 HPP family protein [Asticcacaulis sp. EMRT-3]